MKNDRLSPEAIRNLFSYEPSTGEIRWKVRSDRDASWNNRLAGKKAGTLKKGYVQIVICIDGKACFFSGQRIAWAHYYGEWPDGEVDHKNHDPSDNSIENLRLASHSQNGCHKFQTTGKVPFKGVYWMPTKGRFAAQIKRNRQWKWLGLHDCAEDAARAYDLAAIELHGEFAKTNKQMGLLA